MVQAPEGRAGSSPTVEPLWKDLERIKYPTLVIWGRDNLVQGYDDGLFMLNRVPDVQMRIYGRAGLWVPWEKAAEFNREVISFLAQD